MAIYPTDDEGITEKINGSDTFAYIPIGKDAKMILSAAKKIERCESICSDV